MKRFYQRVMTTQPPKDFHIPLEAFVFGELIHTPGDNTADLSDNIKNILKVEVNDHKKGSGRK